MKFSERLSMLRKQKGLSQEALAEQLGVSRQAVSKWENGEAFPELSKLDAICRIFAVSPNFLMGYEEIPPDDDKKSSKGGQRAMFWLVIGCMGFVVTAFCLGWAVSHPHIYNGIDGLRGSLLGNDCMEIFLIGLVAMIVGLLESYFEISGKGSFFHWLKKKLSWLANQMFKLDEED